MLLPSQKSIFGISTPNYNALEFYTRSGQFPPFRNTFSESLGVAKRGTTGVLTSSRSFHTSSGRPKRSWHWNIWIHLKFIVFMTFCRSLMDLKCFQLIRFDFIIGFIIYSFSIKWMFFFHFVCVKKEFKQVVSFDDIKQFLKILTSFYKNGLSLYNKDYIWDKMK